MHNQTCSDDEKHVKESFLSGAINPFGKCKPWIYWLVIGFLLFVIFLLL